MRKRLFTEGASWSKIRSKSNAISHWLVGRSATPTVKLDGMSKPPSCAKQPPVIADSPMLVLLCHAAPIANSSVSCPM